MNTKAQELNTLFAEWQIDYAFDKDDFHADGIINEELYEQNAAGNKLLLLQKNRMQ